MNQKVPAGGLAAVRPAVRPAGGLLPFFLSVLACVSLGAGSRGEVERRGELECPGLRCADAAGLRFHFSGDAFLARAEELIRDARDYILVDSFLAIEDEKGKRVFDLLKRKTEEGVRVYLITDPSSAFVNHRTAVPYLVDIGLPVTEYNPIRCIRFPRLPRLLRRDHRKYWLIDGRTVVLGGRNIDSLSLSSPSELGNTDVMVEFRSATAFRALLGSFLREWNAWSMDRLDPREFSIEPAKGGDILWLVNQEETSRAGIRRLFHRLLDAAEREVWLVQAYATPTSATIRHIREAASAGVEVNVLFSSYNSKEKFHYAPSYRMLDLIRAGARVWMYESPTSHLHYKAAVVDGRWFSLGSANLNPRSYHLANELNVLFEGRRMGAPLLEHLAELKARSRLVSEEQAAGCRGWKYLLYYLLFYLGG